MPHLGPIYWVTFKLSVYPASWKDSMTIVLRNPGKPDYTIPSAHWPIALLNTVVEVLLACIVEDLARLAELHSMLPDNHFGCQPGRTTTDSLHFMTKYVKDTWRRGEVVSTLFLDIKIPSILLNQLTHNMRTRRVPWQYTDWIASKVRGQCMTLSFDGHVRAAGPDKVTRPGLPSVRHRLPIL